MINFTDITTWHFVTELDIIEIDSENDVTFTITDSNSDVVLNSTYTPVDDKVRIYHITKLLKPIIGGITADFTFTAGSTAKTVHVVQSAIEVSEGAATFLDSFFLSTVMSERDTSLDRKEILTFISTAGSDTVSAACTYWDGTQVVTATKSITATVTAGVPCEIDASASNFTDNTKGELVAYVITAGGRSMKFRVTSLPKCEYALAMYNNFGAWDIVYMAGSSENAPEYTRETAMIYGALAQYNIEEVMTRKSYTGPLRPSGVALAYDLARSNNVWQIKSDGNIPIVITAVDVKYTTEDDTIPDFTFTWQRGSIMGSSLETVRPPRLFDDTFDETYE